MCGGEPNCSTTATAGTDSRAKVLLLLREGSSDLQFMLSREVGVMLRVLEAAGYEVTAASASGRAMGRGALKIRPDLKLTEIRIADFAGLLLPSLAVGLTAPIPDNLVEIVRRAAVSRIPVAAQHGSVVVLQRAGVLKKKRYAFEHGVFAEGTYAGTGVVRDGNIITSGTCPYRARDTGRPDGTSALTRLLIQALGGSGFPAAQ
jgi:4-methyl-5(b-hydroxyethyl)-thiazole monophosphate biosynthesis